MTTRTRRFIALFVCSLRRFYRFLRLCAPRIEHRVVQRSRMCTREFCNARRAQSAMIYFAIAINKPRCSDLADLIASPFYLFIPSDIKTYYICNRSIMSRLSLSPSDFPLFFLYAQLDDKHILHARKCPVIFLSCYFRALHAIGGKLVRKMCEFTLHTAHKITINCLKRLIIQIGRVHGIIFRSHIYIRTSKLFSVGVESNSYNSATSSFTRVGIRFSIREIKRSPKAAEARSRACLKFIFLNRAFFMLPLLPLVSRRFQQQHLNANRWCVAPPVAQLNLTLCSCGRNSRPHSHFRPFRHFSRNFNVQREFSHRPLLAHFAHACARARALSRAYVRACSLCMITAAASCTCIALEFVADILICLLLRHGMFARSLIHVRLYPRSFLGPRSSRRI